MGLWQGDTLVTGSNPGGAGLNVYIAGTGAGSGSGGSLPVTGTVAVEEPVQITGSIDAYFTDAFPVTGSIDAYFTDAVATYVQPASGSSVTSVTSNTASQVVVSGNALRRGLAVYNGATRNMYLKLGAGATTSSFTVRLIPDAYYEMPFGYTGQVDAVWESGSSGFALVTEIV